MSTKRILVIGAGKRVLETALPALAACPERWELGGLYARSEREVEAAGASQRVQALDALDADTLRGADLVYVAVGKPAVPEVLRALCALGPERSELLLDTPVLLPKHYRYLSLIHRFAHVSIAEDVSALPCWDPLDRLRDSGALGDFQSAFFEHSLYAYHGVCAVQRVLGGRVKRARKERLGGEHQLRRYELTGGRRAWSLDPRDYERGGFVLVAERGCVSDVALRAPDNSVLEPMLEGERCVGFRAGEVEARLEEAEVRLLDGDPAQARVFQRMVAMKRVGFYRLLIERHEQHAPGYSLEAGLEDALVDYALEKLGRWRATPLTSAYSSGTRSLLGLVSRLAGK